MALLDRFIRHCGAGTCRPVAALLTLTLAQGCAPVDLATKQYDPQAFYFVDSPQQRAANPERHFAHEYRYLNVRRGTGDLAQRPARLLGLTMSGGGIRSAAFHQGILSGLHAVASGAGTLLERIDYVSSVSGGSWANGFYWSNERTDDEIFRCLDAFATTGAPGAGCNGPLSSLRGRQEIAWLPLNDDGEIEERKMMWEEDIVEAYLGRCNFTFDAGYTASNLSSCRQAAARRPYPVFNSTHSATKERASHDNFPFESTPHYQGTLIDAEGRGFFLRSGDERFLWKHVNWQRSIFGGEKDIPGQVLSLMLAHSSGVIGVNAPFLLQYDFRARYRDEAADDSAIDGLRRTYHLTDGGKSDNLGLLPLLERGVDTIIVSQMGKEPIPDDDALVGADGDFEDINIAARQAGKLLGCAFRTDWRRATQPPVATTAYHCPGVGGKLILVRPTTRNVGDFLAFLKKTHPALHEDIAALDAQTDDEADRFPETPTFKASYPPALIRAYYLLGRYLGQHAIAGALAAR